MTKETYLARLTELDAELTLLADEFAEAVEEVVEEAAAEDTDEQAILANQVRPYYRQAYEAFTLAQSRVRGLKARLNELDPTFLR